TMTVNGTVAKFGSPVLAALSDVTGKAGLDLVSSAYDDRSQTVTISARITNTSKDTLRAPFKVRALGLRSDIGVPVAPDAEGQGGGPVWDFTSLVPAGLLGPGQSSAERALTFKLNEAWPLRARGRQGIVTFDAQILAAGDKGQSRKDKM